MKTLFKYQVFITWLILVALLLVAINSNAALPQISVENRGSSGAGNFAKSGEPWFSCGSNYVVLEHGHHDTFAPAVYAGLANLDWHLYQMRRDGYNTVRVFVEFWNYPNESIGSPQDENGMSSAYLDALANFIRKAGTYNQHVIVILDYFPMNSYYRGIMRQTVTDPGYMLGPGINYNAIAMNAGHIEAKITYVVNIIEALQGRLGDDISNVMAWSVENEMFFRADQYPYTQSEGEIETASGLSFGMEDPLTRQNAADWSAAYYLNRVVDAIREVDQDTLITTGMYTFATLGLEGPDGFDRESVPGENRRPVRPSFISSFTGLDFIDIHMYPTGGSIWSMVSDFDSEEYDQIKGPLIIGEFGAYKFQYPDYVDAARAMRDFLDDLQNYNHTGWLYWTFNADQPNSWDLTDNAGAINYFINPVLRGHCP